MANAFRKAVCHQACEKRKTLAHQMGADGIYLLDAIFNESAPLWLRKIEAVEIL